VDYYTVYKLKRLAKETVQLYLLCFVLDRYQRLNDNLVTAFCALVAQYADEAADEAKEAVYQHKLQLNEDMERGAQILTLFLDPTIDGRSRFATVRERAHQLLDAERLERLSRHLAGEAVFDETAYEWEAIDVIMRKAKRNLRPLLRFLDLQGTPAQAEFLNVIGHMKAAFSTGSPLPLSQLSPSIIPTRLRRYLINSEGTLVRNRYEFLIYRLLRDRLQAGDISCNDSVSFRNLDDDLVDDNTFQHRHAIFTQHGLEVANRPIREQLDELGARLNERFDAVNRQILDGKNAFVRLRDGRIEWKRAVRSQEPLPHEPFFDCLERIDIDTLLLAVDRRCGFMEAFEHVLGRYQKTPLSKPALVATLMAYATDIGLGRMAEISNLTFQELSTTANNFVRLETLHEANKHLSNATAKLPIFRHFDLDEAIHSSSDGQKFEVDIPSFNARYSSKYFGLKKGVVAYTLLGNHVPLNARIIGANEHESHYVFDILYSNSTDIIPSIHSTDTHGTNEVNFALLHLFGYQFAPRYRDFKKRVKTSLYSMCHPNHYRGQPLRPVRKLSEELMVSEWPNVQRILLSLLLKSTTQSVIISKLSAHQRTNRTKRALWEFDNLIKSLYLLDYIDSPGLRKNVQHAVNRGEAYHQLRRAIAYAHGGRFRARSQHEQEIWNECARLVANVVVYYNALILSEVLDELQKRGEIAAIEILKRVSPIAWQHINFYGHYQFDADVSPIDLAAIRQYLSSEEVFRFYTA
jgi:TnpA family transposase